MKIFDRIKRRTAVQQTKASKQTPLFTRVTPGQAISTPRRFDRLADEGYARNVIANRSIKLVAGGLASIPLQVREGDRIQEMHPLLQLLRRPNPTMQAGGLIEQLVSYYLIAGNAYLLAVGPDGRPPRELWTLRPDTIAIIQGKDGLPIAYEQSVGSDKRRFSPEDVLHWRAFNPLSDWYGLAPLEAAASSIDIHNEGSRWNLALIQNGGTPSGVLYQEAAERPLTEIQFQNLKTQVEDHYTGAMNAGRPLLLEGGLRWQDMGLSPRDMDWSHSKSTAAREIALAFGVPPQLVGVPDSQTFANFSEARQSVWEETIIPMGCSLVGELNRWLAPYFGDHVRIEMNLDEIPALEAKRQRKFDRLTSATFLSDEEKRIALGFSKKREGEERQ